MRTKLDTGEDDQEERKTRETGNEQRKCELGNNMKTYFKIKVLRRHRQLKNNNSVMSQYISN